MAPTLRSLAILVAAFVISTDEIVNAERVSLPTWRFRSQNGSIDIPDARVPGTSHTHLLDAGVIGDPYYRFNERAQQWVARETWTYETHVDVSNTTSLAHSKLVFEQLDGVAHVYVNDALVATTTNAFLSYHFDVASLLQRGARNTIRVVFTPALEYARVQSEQYPYPVPATQNFNTWVEPTHRSFIRKAGSDFGWDWGPAFATTGIAGAAFLDLGAATPTLTDLAIVQRFPTATFASVDVTISVGLECHGHTYDNVVFTLLLDGDERCRLFADSVCLRGAVESIELHFTLANPTLWWPAGYGDAHLYNVTLTATNAAFYTTMSHEMGVRRIELHQEPTTAGNVTGETFYFTVNTVPIFIKGANWIPVDSFPTRVTATTTRNLLRSAFEANMNMIRVWGGGRYESDVFYTECDRLGLLVWQELMFACGMYPRDAPFLSLVASEVTAQVTRLRKFTSIAMWGGNNENENMMEQFAVDDFIPDWPFNRDIAVADYSKLFVDTIVPILTALDATRPMVDTSPSNGLYSIDPFVKRWGPVNGIAYGDVHFYDYASDCQSPETFPNARFISEFGFQSAPSLLSLYDVASPTDDLESFHAFWSLLKFRERHANGTLEMLRQLERRFVVPFPFSDESFLATPVFNVTGINVTRRIDAYVYLTQLQQGLCYQTAIRKWRRGKRESLGNTMGILYWQLNDIWQGTSWSSLEFSGRWKALHYVVKREFAPLVLSVHRVDNDTMEVNAVSDIPRAIALDVVYELRSTTTGALLHATTDSVDLDALESQQLRRVRIDDVLRTNKTSCTATTCFLMLQCHARSALSVHEASALCTDVHEFFAPFKALALSDGAIDIVDVRASQTVDHAFDVTIASRSAFVALFVSVETSLVASGFWSDSAFVLIGKTTKVLTFTMFERVERDAPPMTVDALAKSLRVKWLQQLYVQDDDASAVA